MRVYVCIKDDVFRLRRSSLLKEARHFEKYLTAGVWSDYTIAAYKGLTFIKLSEA